MVSSLWQRKVLDSLFYQVKYQSQEVRKGLLRIYWGAREGG